MKKFRIVDDRFRIFSCRKILHHRWHKQHHGRILIYRTGKGELRLIQKNATFATSLFFDIFSSHFFFCITSACLSAKSLRVQFRSGFSIKCAYDSVMNTCLSGAEASRCKVAFDRRKSASSLRKSLSCSLIGTIALVAVGCSTPERGESELAYKTPR